MAEDVRENADGQKVEYNEDTDRYEPVDGEDTTEPEAPRVESDDDSLNSDEDEAEANK